MPRESSPEPFFFGPDEAALFGVYHEARGPNSRGPRMGIVFCQPLAQEYVRAHAALAALASRVARAGFHVLRFDYAGCGDSHGEQCTLGSCERDIALAVKELRQGAAVERVWLFGLRLGASLAATAAELSGADGVVLWEPVVRGESHIQDLRRQQLGWSTAQCEPRGRSSENGEEILGFWLSRALCREIAALDLLALPRPPTQSLLLLTEPRTCPLLDALERNWSRSRQGASLVRRQVPSGEFWRKVENKKGALIPVHALEPIVQSLTQLSVAHEALP